MSKLNSFFGSKGSKFSHPLLTFLEGIQADRKEIEVSRPKDTLGFKAAKIYLHITADEKQQPPAEYAWDDELNAHLVTSGIRSITADNEKMRFALGLRFGFKRAESRFGDGFFNAVLAMVVREEGFAEHQEVKRILNYVSTDQPYMDGNGYSDCREMIERAIGDQANSLVKDLKYTLEQAEDILAGAMAKYLDERFSVSDRERLGWL